MLLITFTIISTGVYFLHKHYSVMVPFKVEYCIKPIVYGTKSMKWYSNDLNSLKDRINRAVTYKQFKACVDDIYYFKIRYSGFRKYGITVDQSVEELIRMIDMRYASVNHKKLFIF